MHVTWVTAKETIPRAKTLLNEKESKVNNKKNVTIDKMIKSDLYHALVPVYYLSKVFGLCPVRFESQTSGRYISQIRILEVCYSVCLLCFLIGAEVWGLRRDLKDGWAHSTRLKSQTAMIVTIGDVLAVALLASVAILGTPLRWKYLQEIMSRLVEADERLGFITPKKTRRFSIIISVGVIGFLVILSSLDIYAWDAQTKSSKKMADKGPINYSPIYGMYMVALMIEIQYSVSTYNLGERFSRLNKNLESLIKGSKSYDSARDENAPVTDPREQVNLSAYIRPEIDYGRTNVRFYRTPKISDWLVNEGETRNISDAVSHLITVHSSLCDVALLINKAYGLPILVVTLTCLFHLIITPYVLLVEANGDKEWFFIAVQCLWCSLHIVRMCIVVQPCYNTATESKKTAIKIGQLLSTNWEPEIRKKLEIFSLQILHRPLEFSACGLFSLDRALVTSMAGAVTTYLVILIQFQKADDTVDASNIVKNVSLFLKNASSLGNGTAFRLAR